MGRVIEFTKNLVFPRGVPYEIKNREILDLNDTYIDHLVDVNESVRPNPLMHFNVDVALNGDGQEMFFVHAVAEFSKNGGVDYSLWNAQSTKNQYDALADIVNLPKPGVAYWLLGHDLQTFLQESTESFKSRAGFELEHQLDGRMPKRGIDLPNFHGILKRYQTIK